MNEPGMAGTCRIGVDVGGTFTDLIFEDGTSGAVGFAKVPTTPADPAAGVVHAVSVVRDQVGSGTGRHLVHGHTVGLNALLERRGARLGLLATAGFRDVIEVGRGDRGDPYDLFWHRPEPLVPRRRRVPIAERIAADGRVVTALVEEDVVAALGQLVAEDVECIAIAFINAYANPSHELMAAAILREHGFDGDIAVSHRVSGEYREYERTCTTLVDAYIRPRVSGYLESLEARLREIGISGELLVARSGGGALTFADAQQRPFESIMSGPVGGAQGASSLAGRLGLADVVTADVGGTSFDTCLIAGGRLSVLHEGSVVGLPLQSTWVDVRSVGAGGGSIAYVDEGELLQVGPMSAGADPGPACYGRGGDAPTVTDAAFVLGMLGQGQLASGLQLDRDLALAAFAPLGDRLDMEAEELASGVISIAAARMGHAIREITIEQGVDPRGAVLMAFGGAGPLFATSLAAELQISDIVVPAHAGNFSAWGLLDADVTRSAARTRILRLSSTAISEASATFAELRDSIATGAGSAGLQEEAQLDLRYHGQEHTLTLDVPVADGAIVVDSDALEIAFGEEYRRVYGHALAEEVEIVTVRALARAPVQGRSPARETGRTPSGDDRAVRAYSRELEEWSAFRLVRRDEIAGPLAGPAIVVEATCTTYLDALWVATPDDGGSLRLRRAAPW